MKKEGVLRLYQISGDPIREVLAALGRRDGLSPQEAWATFTTWRVEDPKFTAAFSALSRARPLSPGITGRPRVEAYDGLEDWKSVWAARYIVSGDPIASAEGILSARQVYARLKKPPPPNSEFDPELFDLKERIEWESAHNAMKILKDATDKAYSTGDYKTAVTGAVRLAEKWAPRVFGRHVHMEHSGNVNHQHMLPKETRLEQIAEQQMRFQRVLSGEVELGDDVGIIDVEYVEIEEPDAENRVN